MSYNKLPLIVKSGGTGVSSTTAYAPILGGTTSTGNMQSIAMGTSGKVLMSNGSSALPSWNSVNSWVLLNTQNSTSSTQILFESLISSTYKTYALTYSNVQPNSGTPLLALRVSATNGAPYQSTGYQSGSVRVIYTGTSYAGPTTDTTLIYLSNPLSTSFFAQGQVFLHNVGNGGMFMVSGNVSNGNFNQNVMGYSTETAVNAIRINMGGATITGNFSLYGIRES